MGIHTLVSRDEGSVGPQIGWVRRSGLESLRRGSGRGR